MQPVGSPNNANVLTIDIPEEWERTKGSGALGPNIWARTGCRYDEATDRAQCETGGSGGVVDISKAKLSAPGGTTITEWIFAESFPKQGGGTYLRDSFDISGVNGVSLTVDIQAVNGSAEDPGGPNTLNWLAKVAPLAIYGDDIRADANCPQAFRLQRSDLTGLQGPIDGRPWPFGFVIINNNKQPLGGDATVACFSNCGKYKFPLEPLPSCNLDDPRCLGWNVFCAGDGTRYGAKCNSDADCQVHASCWDQHDIHSPIDHTCQLRGFLSDSNKTTCDGDNCTSPCPPDVCTFPYGFENPFTQKPDFSSQPPFGACSDVFSANTDAQCVGEDRIHKVFPRAYTWPNDPQVYISDAEVYRVVFSPGGTNVPITPSVGALPLCEGLPEIYEYVKNRDACAIDISNGAVFAIARPSTKPWSCVAAGAANDGVVCRWKAGPPPTHLTFDGIPGQANCENVSKASLARLYGGLSGAAPLLGFASQEALDRAIDNFCRGS